MPRNGSGVYSLPSGSTFAPDTTIESAKVNAINSDLVTDANAARPVTAGGTGATTASGAATELNVVSYGTAQSLSAANQSQARANISAPLKGHIYGLTLSNNATDATNDIDIAVGEAASTETNPVLMALSSALTKRIDATWAVGTNQGGLDTGSKANSTWYHVWLIQRSDTGVVDALFSTSATAPTMPTNYDRKRLVNSIYVGSGGAIRPFMNAGRFVYWTDIGALDVSATGNTSGANYTISVPPGRQVMAAVNAAIGPTGGGYSYYLYTPGTTIGISTTTAPLATLSVDDSGHSVARQEVLTNTTSQIGAIVNLADTLRIYTLGWAEVDR